MLKNILTCFNKDFKFYFQSKMIYLLVAIYGIMLFAFVLYSTDFLSNTTQNLHQFFSMQLAVMSMIIPATTMRAWADEYKHGTLDILFSLPMNKWAIVLGKFLAAWAVCSILVLSTILFCFILSLFVQLSSITIFINYIIILLFCGCLCALSIFASTIFNNMLGAFVMSLAICSLFISMPFEKFVTKIIPDNVFFAHLAASFNFGNIYDIMINGQIYVSSIIYLLLLGTASLWLTTVMVEYKRS